MKGKNKLFVFFAICMLQYLAANFAHPITPTLIVNLNLPSYMFGAAFAAMSFTNFLFSPFWGKMRDYFSAKKILLIGCLGYSFGQFLFSIMKTQATILFARCVSGFFVGSVSVGILVYIIEFSPEEKTGENLTLSAILHSLGAAFGYLIGGVIGAYSIRLTFTVQSICLALSGILFYTFLEDSKNKSTEKIVPKNFIKDINPLKSFFDCRYFMTKALAFLFAVVVFANIGTYAFDQCFNYYLKDQFNFNSSYNGAIKAVVGFITLIVNGTICMRIIKKKTVKQYTAFVYICCAISILVMLCVHDIKLFIIVCIVFYGFNAIYIPLIQNTVAKDGGNKSNNLVMGFFNATKSLGMILGALIAGFIYNYGSTLPFIFSSMCFLIAAVLLIINISINKKINKSVQ